MSRVQMIGVGAALTTFVSVGATATDARVGMLITAVQTALESDMEIELGLIVDGPHGALSVLDLPVVVAVLVLLFGGLPVAVFGLLFDRQWAGVPTPRRPNLRVPYALLIFQIVSMGISALCLAVMGEALLWALSEDLAVQRSDWFLPVYLAVQIPASIAAIPVWRRLMLDASDVGTRSWLSTRAQRATGSALRPSDGFPAS